MQLRNIRVTFAILLAVQIYALGRWHTRTQAFLGFQSDVLEGRTQANPSELGILSLQASAWRDIRGASRVIPGRQRVLVLTSNSVNIRYDYFLFPHETQLLIRDAAEFLELAATHRPKYARIIRRRLEDIRRLNQEATPERETEELAKVDWVILYGTPEPLPESAGTFEMVESVGEAYVFRRAE